MYLDRWAQCRVPVCCMRCGKMTCGAGARGWPLWQGARRARRIAADSRVDALWTLVVLRLL
jgi:hypothetical protein